jgi:hypothetical protein
MSNEELLKELENHLELLKKDETKNWIKKKINAYTIKRVIKAIEDLKKEVSK